MKITLITTFYNSYTFIPSFVSNLAGQTASKKNFELIMVDDGSTDDSFKLAKNLTLNEPNVHVIRQKNMGLGPARNFGLKHATGEYILFLDIDDALEPDAIQFLLGEISRSVCDIYAFDSTVYTADLTEIADSSIQGYFSRPMEAGLYVGHEFFKNSLLSSSLFPPVWLYLYRYRFLYDNELKFEAIIHEDCVFTLLASDRAETVKYLKRRLHRRRDTVGSMTSGTASIKRVKGALRVLEQADQFCTDNQDPEMYKPLNKWFQMAETQAISVLIKSKVLREYRRKLTFFLLCRLNRLNVHSFYHIVEMYLTGLKAFLHRERQVSI